MRVERPWGWYETLTQGENYLVKRLLVRAGQQLSLQRIVTAVKVGPSWLATALCSAAISGIRRARA